MFPGAGRKDVNTSLDCAHVLPQFHGVIVTWVKRLAAIMDNTINTNLNTSASSVDVSTLTALLNMGGPELRANLCAQLITDFTRLRGALANDHGAAVARAAHEVKGLALTVGASKLADLAIGLDGVAQSLPASALALMVKPLTTEIDAVLSVLGDAAQAPA